MKRQYLSGEEMDELIKRWRSSKGHKRERIFGLIAKQAENLIYKRIRQLIGYRTELIDDCFQAGLVALHKALQKYKFGMGAKFITYLGFWLNAEIIRQLRLQNGPVYVPPVVQLASARKVRAEGELPPEELYKQPRYLYWDKPSPASLQEGGESQSIMDFVCAHRELCSENPAPESMDLEAALQLMYAQIDKLPGPEQKALRGRLDGKTLQEVGDEMSLSRERVRQLEVRAVATLRKRIKESGALNDLSNTQNTTQAAVR